MVHRRAGFPWFVAAVGLGAAVACSDAGDAGDAGGDAGGDVVYGHHSTDAAVYEAAADEKTPDNRLTPHLGKVLSAPHVWAIYIGAPGYGQSQSFDAYMTWMLGSTSYWSILAQYGVGYGTFDGRTDIATDAFFLPGMVNAGFVDWLVLEKRIREVIHPSADAGAPDAGNAGDAGDDGGVDASDDGGDASTTIPPIPPADAYVVFLPDGVNVDLGNGTTCANAGGYHSFDGVDPYAIIPPCGRYDLVVSHEMAEMVTDPLPGDGWYSDPDQYSSGGEIGDLCNYVTTVDSHAATQLWSNKDGDCEPP
jgi:hypothetical protein